MEQSSWQALLDGEARRAQALVMPFVLSHVVVLALIVMGGDGLDSPAQLAIAAFIVLGSLWCLSQWDGVQQSVAALVADMDGDLAGSNIGKVFAGLPIGAIRAVQAVIVAVMAVLEVIALYD